MGSGRLFLSVLLRLTEKVNWEVFKAVWLYLLENAEAFDMIEYYQESLYLIGNVWDYVVLAVGFA